MDLSKTLIFSTDSIFCKKSVDSKRIGQNKCKLISACYSNIEFVSQVKSVLMTLLVLMDY